MPSKSFNFDKILLDAMIKLSMLLNIIICNQVFYQGMKKVSLQKTFSHPCPC
jgi:hypothetical protein